MTTRPRGKIEGAIPVTITVSGSEYKFLADPNITRIQINDRPQAFRTDQSQAYQGQFRDGLVIGGIWDAFAARAIGPWGPRQSISDHLAHGHIHVLHDSECETRFGVRTPSRQKNTLTFPTLGVAGSDHDSLFGGAYPDNATTRQSFHDRPGVYYQGSTTSGWYVWEAHADDTSNNVGVYSYAWTGAAFSSEVAIITDTVPLELRGYDMCTHKGILFWAGTTTRGTAANNAIRTTTSGASWADPGTEEISNAWLEGTRFIDDGATLWLVVQAANKAIYLMKSTNAGSTWTNYTLAGQGQVRSVGKYFNRSLTVVLVVLTEDGLYEIDEINYRLNLLWRLPFPGRGMIEWGGSLFIFMDAMGVYRYTQNEGKTLIEDVSPGGGEAMPSGKDFRTDTDGQVVLTASSRGIYAAWSGDGPTSGTLNRALCLFYNGLGWHFIWRAANTTNDVGYSARALFLDPTSGDLIYLGATISASNEARAHDSVRIIQVETDPRLLSANIFETSSYSETPLITVAPTVVPTTFLDIFYNSENLTTGVTVQTQFGVDGVAATTSTLETNAITVNRAKRYFPSDATAAGTAAGTEGAGSSFSTIRLRELLVGTATAGPLVYNTEIGYTKPTDAKDIILVDVIVDPGVTDMVIPAVDTLWTNIATVRNSKTKVTLNYSKVQSDILVLPIAEARMRQLIPSIEAVSAPRTGTLRFVLAQV